MLFEGNEKIHPPLFSFNLKIRKGVVGLLLNMLFEGNENDKLSLAGSVASPILFFYGGKLTLFTQNLPVKIGCIKREGSKEIRQWLIN